MNLLKALAIVSLELLNLLFSYSAGQISASCYIHTRSPLKSSSQATISKPSEEDNKTCLKD